MRTRILIILALLLVSLVPALAQETAPAVVVEQPVIPLDQWLAYDQTLPLNAELTPLSETSSYTAYNLQYDSAHDQRVPAVYVLPKGGTPPYPAVVFLHGYGGNKQDVLDFATFAAPLGYALISIDAEYHGDRKREGLDLYGALPYTARDGMIQTVIDLCRAVDYLETVPEEIDARRIGYGGGSMGGILGCVLAGVDQRIRTAVLWVAGADWALMAKTSQINAGKELRKTDLDLDLMGKILAPVDPMYWVDKISPRPVLFLNGDHDVIVPVETNKLLHSLAKEPFKVVWYNSGHGLPYEQAIPETLKWLETYLKPLPPEPAEGEGE